MDCYFDPPVKYQLTQPPLLHMIRTNTVRLFSHDLQSNTVHYIKVDTRADSVKCILRRSGPECAESLETFVPPDSVCHHSPCSIALNWWTHVHSWVTKRGGTKTHLSLVLLTEDYLGDDQLANKLSTYVEFLIPDVVVLNKCWRETPVHGALMAKFDTCTPFGLRDGENTFFVYNKDHLVNVTAHLAKDFAYLDIKRACSTIVLHGLGPHMKKKNKRSALIIEDGNSVVGDSEKN